MKETQIFIGVIMLFFVLTAAHCEHDAQVRYQYGNNDYWYGPELYYYNSGTCGARAVWQSRYPMYSCNNYYRTLYTQNNGYYYQYHGNYPQWFW